MNATALPPADALTALRNDPTTRIRVHTTWVVCVCTNGAHGIGDQDRFTDFDGGPLAMHRHYDHKRRIGLPVHALIETDFVGMTRQEITVP